MRELGKPSNTEFLRAVARRLFFGRQRLLSWPMNILSRDDDHRLAMLVHQGNDPTLPYQALVIRESATLCLGFAPGVFKAFSFTSPVQLGRVLVP